MSRSRIPPPPPSMPPMAAMPPRGKPAEVRAAEIIAEALRQVAESIDSLAGAVRETRREP